MATRQKWAKTCQLTKTPGKTPTGSLGWDWLVGTGIQMRKKMEIEAC
jgi:hypothetical protein